MKTNRFVKGILLLPFLITTKLAAQSSVSINLQAIRQRNINAVIHSFIDIRAAFSS